MIKIIDMNFDCIALVLKLLTTRDLLNVAQSNQTLNAVACFVISRRYFEQKLVFNFIIPCTMVNMVCVTSTDKFVQITPFDFESGLKILRHVGRVFSIIKINYNYVSLQQRKQLEFHLSEYFAKCETSSAMEIVLENCPEDAFRWMDAPWKSVHEVEISGYNACNFKELNAKIPNMKSLKLKWLEVVDGKCIEQNFPNLKHFEVDVRDRIHHFTEENVQNAVLMNPQLQTVVITLHNHPDLKEDELKEFLKNNFETPGKLLRIVPHLADIWKWWNLRAFEWSSSAVLNQH